MQASQVVSSVKEWRWTPCVAIILASLLYVALALAIVPSSVDTGPADAANRNAQSPPLESPALGHSMADEEPEDSKAPAATSVTAMPAMPAVRTALPPPLEPERVVRAMPYRRGFSPPLPRAEPPVVTPPPIAIPTAPPVPPPAPEQPVPPPGAMAGATAPAPSPQGEEEEQTGAAEDQAEQTAGQPAPGPMNAQNSPSVRAAAAARSAAALLLRGRRNINQPDSGE